MFREWSSSSPEETEEVGREIARLLPEGALCAFYGDLGAGKTTLIKGVVSELTGIDPSEISSPTFTYMTPYEGKGGVVYHFDLYRMADLREFCRLGLDDYFDGKAICCIEWADRLGEALPPTFRVTLLHRGEGKRTIQLES